MVKPDCTAVKRPRIRVEFLNCIEAFSCKLSSLFARPRSRGCRAQCQRTFGTCVFCHFKVSVSVIHVSSSADLSLVSISLAVWSWQGRGQNSRASTTRCYCFCRCLRRTAGRLCRAVSWPYRAVAGLFFAASWFRPNLREI